MEYGNVMFSCVMRNVGCVASAGVYMCVCVCVCILGACVLCVRVC